MVRLGTDTLGTTQGSDDEKKDEQKSGDGTGPPSGDVARGTAPDPEPDGDSSSSSSSSSSSTSTSGPPEDDNDGSSFARTVAGEARRSQRRQSDQNVSNITTRDVVETLGDPGPDDTGLDPEPDRPSTQDTGDRGNNQSGDSGNGSGAGETTIVIERGPGRGRGGLPPGSLGNLPGFGGRGPPGGEGPPGLVELARGGSPRKQSKEDQKQSEDEGGVLGGIDPATAAIGGAAGLGLLGAAASAAGVI